METRTAHRASERFRQIPNTTLPAAALLQKMLLRWYRQIKIFPADQETLAAENTA